jgi:predicted heme/steroid binding protein
MAGVTGQGDKLNVFISYSRDDLGFADQLDASLQLGGFETTIDRRGISGGEDWKARLGALIRDADTVVFVLSPSSALSSICAWEVEEAVRLGKRIIPTLCRALEGVKPPQELTNLDYIYFYAEPSLPGTGFGAGLRRLASALDTDLYWLREHTRYLRLAKEWEEVGKSPDRRLLSAPDIALAKAWAESRPTKAPVLTALQLDFIEASEAEDERQKSAEARRVRQLESALAERQKAQDLAVQQRDRALQQESRALAIFAQQASNAGDQSAAMLLALEALPDPGFGGARPWSSDAAAALHQAWLRNRETTLAGHRGEVISASFSADGTHVVTASQDKTARVWDLRGGRPSFVALEGHQERVNFASFNADGTHVVTASWDGTARVWDLRGEGPSFVALEGHQKMVTSASFSADGTHVVTASWDGTARVWDLGGKRLSFVALKRHRGAVWSASFSADGTHVVTASSDNTARVWDLRGKRPSFVALEGHQDGVTSAAFNSDGTHLVTASRNGTVRVWDLRGERLSFVPPRKASRTGQLRVFQCRRDVCGHSVGGRNGASVGLAPQAAQVRCPRGT